MNNKIVTKSFVTFLVVLSISGIIVPLHIRLIKVIFYKGENWSEDVTVPQGSHLNEMWKIFNVGSG